MSFIAAYITCKNRKEALNISRSLLKARLIGCANIFPCESVFTWKGRIGKTKEYVIIAKSQKKHKSAIINAVKKMHSYEIPCVNFLPVDIGDRDYASWLENSI